MIIIGGEAKGRHLHIPRGCQIRPTSYRVKEALFNVLHPISGKTFLDLFAGSGNVGIEALSRGTIKTVFVEKDPNLVKVIRRNLYICGFHDRYEILAMDFQKSIKKMQREKALFDLVFADSPYEEGLIDDIIQSLGRCNLISDDGIIIIQHSIREAIRNICPFILIDQKRYGDTNLSFLK